MRKNALQIRQLPPSDKDQLAARLPERMQRRNGLFGDPTVFRQGAVIIGREGDKVHQRDQHSRRS